MKIAALMLALSLSSCTYIQVCTNDQSLPGTVNAPIPAECNVVVVIKDDPNRIRTIDW